MSRVRFGVVAFAAPAGARIAFGLVAVMALAASAPAPASAQEVDYPHGDTSKPLDCTWCHTQEGWSPAKQPMEFDHAAETGFDQTGRHSELECGSCHLGLEFAEPKLAATGCSVCHVDVHIGNLSVECETCHNTTAWNDVPGIGLHARTSLPLALSKPIFTHKSSAPPGQSSNRRISFNCPASNCSTEDMLA